MHVVIESSNKTTVTNILDTLMEEQLPEDSVLMVSCSKSSGQYRATIDLGGPEPSAT